MGNCNSKKSTGQPESFFDREIQNQKLHNEKIRRKLNPENRRVLGRDPQQATTLPAGPPSPVPQPFDDDTLELMRYQLRKDADAFLLNNILMSVQFFENYERDLEDIKRNVISDREHGINEAMVRYNKHVFFADRIQDYVNECVGYQRTSESQVESLTATRLFVIYDNMEASGPGDLSDYSPVLDAPFYKLCVEDCKEPGYVGLKRLEVLESTLPKERYSTDSIYPNLENESSDSENSDENFFEEINKSSNVSVTQTTVGVNNITLDNYEIEHSGRRVSGPTRIFSTQVNKSNISKMKEFKRDNIMLPEEEIDEVTNTGNNFIREEKDSLLPRKSILKISKPKDRETTSYRSRINGRLDEASESDSEYGYTTITHVATPKEVVVSSPSNNLISYGVLPDKTWNSVQMKSSESTQDEDEEFEDDLSISSGSDTTYYLNSIEFMNNFVDSFIFKLGSVLGLSYEVIQNSKTQGASIYCFVNQANKIIVHEVFPALNATWPNGAISWPIRERKVIKNPRTNFEYQWPTKYMVRKVMGFGCLLIPIGYRPKRGTNEKQNMQWKITFPAAERYLESCLAHAHMRCYLFTLTLYKTFIENNTSKIGIDVSHIKNHLFWQCEDNYAKWPEHRLGESLREFLRSFYSHFSQGRFPNYFMVNCNDFEGIPQPLLIKQQHNLFKILEAPVMHVLNALSKLKYNKEEFYPKFNVNRLYNILTTKNILDLINPNLPIASFSYEKQKAQGNQRESKKNNTMQQNDQGYQRKKKKVQNIRKNEKRKGQLLTNTQVAPKQEDILKTNIILPKELDPTRRRLVLEFFISHFIAIATSSEKFNAITQAIIYLEQAQRLCVLLSDDPSSQSIADEFLTIIKEKLVDCQKKLVTQVGFNRPLRRDSNADRKASKFRPRYERHSSQESSADVPRSPVTLAQIHGETSSSQLYKFHDYGMDVEESKL